MSTIVEKFDAMDMTASESRDRVLVLSTFLMTHRMIAYNDFLPSLRRHLDVGVWAIFSDRVGERPWSIEKGECEPFPEARPLRLFPNTYLRRVNDFAWDFRLRLASRMSIDRRLKRKSQSRGVRMLRWPARLLSAMRLEERFESFLLRRLERADRGPGMDERVRAWNPSLVLSTAPSWYNDPAVTSAARRLGVPCLAMITSFDNLSTKDRMVFRYDGYLLWSEQMRNELHEFYPYTRNLPTYVVGAPQFDVLLNKSFHTSRAEFCRSMGLDPHRPIIMYAMGSPNLFREIHAVRMLATEISSGRLGDAQLLVRPHPIFDNGTIVAELGEQASQVAIQPVPKKQVDPSDPIAEAHDHTIRWVNSFLHSDVVVNLSSTSAVDAAVLDRPVVNLNFDPDPSRQSESLVKEINHQWLHYKAIAESGGMWLVNNYAEMFKAIRGYLEHPELHREKRRWIAQHVAGFTDGRSGERMAEAVLDFLANHASRSRKS